MATHPPDLQSTADYPLFSVIVPFLNEERWLPKCLAAPRAQSIDPGLVEWILIDNGPLGRPRSCGPSRGRRCWPSLTGWQQCSVHWRALLARRSRMVYIIEHDIFVARSH